MSILAYNAGACKKDSPVLDTNTSMLTTRPWHIVAYTSTENTQPPKVDDWYATFPAYRKDDTYQFKADNSLVFDEGTLKENTSDPQTATGKWQFQNNQTELAITLGKRVPLGTSGISSTTTYGILKLNADTLRLTTGTQAQTSVITLSK